MPLPRRENSPAQRFARHWKRWCTKSFVGLMSSNRRALIMITRQEIDPRDVLNVLRSRWPDVVVKDLQQEEPTWAMLAAGRWSEWS